jgi:hypothetical protein
MEAIEDNVGKDGEKHTALAYDLSAHAEIVYPVIDICYRMFQSRKLSAFDLVGVYILAFLAVRRPKRWISGKIPSKILRDEEFGSICSMELNCIPAFARLVDVGWLSRKIHKLSTGSDVTVCRIFNEFHFCGIKNKDFFINRCLLMWATGQRPVVLMFHIPSPKVVLDQQSRGERVVTMFVNKESLSKTHKSLLAYMDGNINHARDPLEFLLHDFQHMEHFVSQDIYYEQIGFFKSISTLKCGLSIREFLCKFLCYDEQLWHETEYAISDM